VLDIRQGLTVERRDSASEAVDEAFELTVWNGAVDIPVTLGKFAIEVLTPEQYLERPAPSDHPRQPRRRAASRNGTEADLHLAVSPIITESIKLIGGWSKVTRHSDGVDLSRMKRMYALRAVPFEG
jgi:hypothetical protein